MVADLKTKWFLAMILLWGLSGCDAIIPGVGEVDVADLARTWPPYQTPVTAAPLSPNSLVPPPARVQPPNRQLDEDGEIARELIPLLPPIRPIKEWDLSETAIDSLGRIGVAAVPGLVQVLQHPNPLRRSQAAQVLGRIGPAAQMAVPSLIRALQDVDPNVRKAAVRALGQIGPEAAEAVGPLLALIDRGSGED